MPLFALQIDEELSNLEPTSHKKPEESPKQQVIGILLDVKEPSQIKLLFSYLVHNAGWTPKYDLRVISANKTMQVSYFGMIQQNTGEDWYVAIMNGGGRRRRWGSYSLISTILSVV